MEEQGRRMAMEHMRAHLARADSELEAALRFVDPKTNDEAELDYLRMYHAPKYRNELRRLASYFVPGPDDEEEY